MSSDGPGSGFRGRRFDLTALDRTGGKGLTQA